MVNTTNVHYNKTRLCDSAFTSECHIKERLLHIPWVEGIRLGDQEGTERRRTVLHGDSGGKMLLLHRVLSSGGNPAFNVVALGHRTRNCG